MILLHWALCNNFLLWFSNQTEGTALSCAAAQGHDMIVQYLLSNGASTLGGYGEKLEVVQETFEVVQEESKVVQVELNVVKLILT